MQVFMMERIFILVAVALAVFAIWGIVRLWQRRMIRSMQVASPFASFVPANMPAVIAFSSPGCGECKTRQAPALTQLEQEFGAQITIVKLSAPDHPELVEQTGILTVPATIVLDRHGVVRHLNLGFVDALRLKTQILGHA
jgi:thiol-disulfide isomerase/thioredoxin